MKVGSANVARIVGVVDGRRCVVGEVYLYEDGTASVYDDLWCDPVRYFDGPDGHHRAMLAIVNRIIAECELVW